MKRIDEELYDVKLKINEKKRLSNLLANTKSQLLELKAKRAMLLKQLKKEEMDVKKLEGLSLANFIHIVAGNKFGRLEKEKKEALSAKLKYDEVNAEVNNLSHEVAELNHKLSGLGNVEDMYMKLISKKEKMMISGESGRLHQILEEMADLKSMEKELSEALMAGHDLLNSLEQVRENLDSASSWGMWDIFGGGLISNMAKHSEIDRATSEIDHAQSLLRRFERELKDVGAIDINIDIGNFMTFADFFFDGLLVDLAVQSKINDAQERVNDTIRKVDSITSTMKNELSQVKNKLTGLEKERIEIIEQA